MTSDPFSDLPTGPELDGITQVAESTWAVYGRTTYDGEIILGEFHDLAEARAVLGIGLPPPSRHADGVLLGGGDLLGERQDEVAADSNRDAGEGVEPDAGAATVLEPGDP